MPAGEQSITLTTSLLLKRWSLNLRHLETLDITRTIPSISQFKNLSHSWPFVTETRCMRPRGTHVTSVFVTTPASWAQTCAFSQPVFQFSRRKDLSLPVTSHTAHPSASWLSDLFVPSAAQQGQHWHHPIKLVPVEMRLFTGMRLGGVIMETRLEGSTEDPQSSSRLFSRLIFPLDKHIQRPNLFRSTLLKEQELSWQMVFPHLIKNTVQHLDALNEENKQQLDGSETL